MGQTTNYYQLGRKLIIRYPDFARHLIEDDNQQYDIDTLIPEAYLRYICQHPQPDTRYEQSRHRLEFIAVIVRHLDPEALTTDKPLKNGVRCTLAKTFNCSNSLISHGLKSVKNYIVIYKDFRIAVEYLYAEIFKIDAGTKG